MFDLQFPQQRRNQVRIGVWGCPHPKADLDHDRNTISETITNMEVSEGLQTDLVLILGDFSSNQNPPTLVGVDDIAEGENIVSQLSSGVRYAREHFYTIRGNHDGGDMNNNWFNRYIDNFGENTAYSGVDNSLRPYPIICDGVNEDHYGIPVGNILFLMINDCNDVLAPVGRSGGVGGGYPSGTISTLSWEWIKQMIIDYPNHTIIVCHHNSIKDTTIATGDNEGVNGGYHGASGQSIASGRLENIYNRSDDTYTDSSDIITYMNANNGKIFAWFAAHTHITIGETYATRTDYSYRYGTHFIMVGSLSRYHVPNKDAINKYIVCEKGSNKMYVLQYINYSSTATKGFYPANEIELTMPRKFIK